MEKNDMEKNSVEKNNMKKNDLQNNGSKKNRLFSTKDMMLISMFAALTAVLSQIAVPLPFTPVPINLATLSVYMSGGMLGPVIGGVSQAIYVLIGAAGAPVFAKFSGGIGIVAGPTGGYIVGYIFAAAAVGALKRKAPRTTASYILCMAAASLCFFIPGTAWFMLTTKTDLAASISMCVLPFIPGDCLKIALAAALVRRLEAAGDWAFSK